jgi:hypothetical protein
VILGVIPEFIPVLRLLTTSPACGCCADAAIAGIADVANHRNLYR